MNPSAAVWAASIGAVLVLLAVDLYVSARRSSESLQRSVITSSLWIFVAVVFGVGVLFWYGPEWGAQYFAGYVTEKALSVDNLFVFAVVLGALGVAEHDRPKVLRYGIAGALVARAGLIFAGVGLLEHFAWASYVLGGLVLATGLRMVAGRRRGEGTAGPAPRWLARVRPASLLVAVGMLEAVDVAFALDSVPAVLAITRVPYLAFMSNAFAVVGLRSLYFVLERALVRLRYLQVGLSIILGLVGVKMLVSDLWEAPVWSSLAAIGLVLATTTALSIPDLRRRAEIEPA